MVAFQDMEIYSVFTFQLMTVINVMSMQSASKERVDVGLDTKETAFSARKVSHGTHCSVRGWIASICQH